MDQSIWEELSDRLNLRALGKPAIIGLAALIILVAVFAGKNLVGAATANEFEIVHDGSKFEDSTEVSSNGELGTIFVHVSGAVKSPGLVELEAESRVADAIAAAGGFSSDAVTESVNLARMLDDGEQLHVSSSKEANGGDAGIAQGDSPGVSQGGEAQPASSGKVNLNSASESELETLPGIGPSTAEKIISYRVANGSFSSIDELQDVSGIGAKKLEAIRDLVCV